MNKKLTFDQMFSVWISEETKSPKKVDWLKVAKQKGFSSVAEWRLNSALRMGLDKLNWQQHSFKNPSRDLPKILIGPFQGWQQFLDGKLQTSFEQAMENSNFLGWCKKHDRLSSIIKDFPFDSTLIVLQLPNKKYLHIAGGHRICAVTYANFIGKPIKFKQPIKVFTANIDIKQLPNYKKFLRAGTNKG